MWYTKITGFSLSIYTFPVKFCCNKLKHVWLHIEFVQCTAFTVFSHFWKNCFHPYILAWVKTGYFPLYGCNCWVKRGRTGWFYVLSFKKYATLLCCHIWTWVPVVYFFFSQYLAVFTFVAFIDISRSVSINSFLEKYICWLLSKKKSCLFWQQIQDFHLCLFCAGSAGPLLALSNFTTQPQFERMCNTWFTARRGKLKVMISS